MYRFFIFCFSICAVLFLFLLLFALHFLRIAFIFPCNLLGCSRCIRFSLLLTGLLRWAFNIRESPRRRKWAKYVCVNVFVCGLGNFCRAKYWIEFILFSPYFCRTKCALVFSFFPTHKYVCFWYKSKIGAHFLTLIFGAWMCLWKWTVFEQNSGRKKIEREEESLWKKWNKYSPSLKYWSKFKDEQQKKRFTVGRIRNAEYQSAYDWTNIQLKWITWILQIGISFKSRRRRNKMSAYVHDPAHFTTHLAT